jgi:hypothetical protein
MNTLLQLLGIHVGPTARVVDVELVLRAGAWAPWLALLAAILGAASVLLYRREDTTVSRFRRYLMATLRAGFLALLVLMLASPAIKVTLEGDIRRQILILLDGSQSMSIRDARTESDDLARAGIAAGVLDVRGGLEQSLPAEVRDRQVAEASRLDLVRKLLPSTQLGLLRELSRDYDLRFLRFGVAVEDLVSPASSATRPSVETDSPLDALAADSSATALGTAVRESLSRFRGQPVAGMLVVTDGASNAGVSALSAAAAAGQNGVPLHLYGVGLTRPKDLAATQVIAPDVGFVDDEIVAAVRLRVTGLEGQTATIRIKLGETQVATQESPIGADGVLTVPVKFTPKQAGEFVLTAEAAPLPGEVVRDNNAATSPLRVVDGRIKVLVVETQPRWEFKYLQAMLLRDRRVQPKFVLLEASATLSDAPDSPYLRAFPATREQLFEYDLLILGDVDPRAFTAEQLNWIEQHVTRFGAGLVTLAGRQRMPSLWSGTPIEKLIPVEWEAPTGSAPRRQEVEASPVRLELTQAGRMSMMLRLAESEDGSAEIYAQLPPVYFTAPILRARPAADVLLVDPSPDRSGRFGKMPVLAVQQVGVGTSLFIGTDNLWRWRRNIGDEHHARLWGQIVQRLALPHLLGESKRTQLSSDKRAYSAGETAQLFARLYSPTFEPVTLPSVRGFLERIDSPGNRTPVVLRTLPDQPGMYRGETVIPAPGTYHFTVESDDKTHLQLAADESRVELTDTAMNEPLLREMARLSGGTFLREESLYQLPESISAKTQRVRSIQEGELWASPFYLALLLILLTLEWILRKGALLR